VSRIFGVLAVISVALIVLTVGLGLRIGTYNETYLELIQIQRHLSDAQGKRDARQVESLQAAADQVYERLSVPRERARLHMLIGIGASLIAILVHSIAVTYFIGTGRWCKEVVDTYQLDRSLSDDSVRLKRRCFAWALVGMLVTLTIVALGAAADPGTLRATTGRWVLPHFFAALGGGAAIAAAFAIEVNCIRNNSAIVQRILEQVRAVRLARGLEVEG
jgi:hypothetical protein